MERMNVKIGGKTYGIFIFCIYSNHWSGKAEYMKGGLPSGFGGA